MTDYSHLDALYGALGREEERLDAAKTEREKAFRVRCIASKRKEIAFEKEHLKSIESDAFAEIEAMTSDELLAELQAQDAPVGPWTAHSTSDSSTGSGKA